MASTPRQTISGELVVIPNPLTPTRQLALKSDSSGRFGVFYSEDNGAKWKPLILAPTESSHDRAGALLTLSKDLGAEWNYNPQIVARGQASSSSSSGSIAFGASFAATLQSSTVFGLIHPPNGRKMKATEVHMTLGTTANANVSVEIVDASGNKLPQAGNRWTIQIPAGVSTAIKQFPSPLTLRANTTYKLKVTGCGDSDAPGEFLDVQVFCELES